MSAAEVRPMSVSGTELARDAIGRLVHVRNYHCWPSCCMMVSMATGIWWESRTIVS